MYVCLCHGISDKTIRHLVQKNQVTSIKSLRSCVPLGSDCGKCVRQAKMIIDSELALIPKIEEVA